MSAWQNISKKKNLWLYLTGLSTPGNVAKTAPLVRLSNTMRWFMSAEYLTRSLWCPNMTYYRKKQETTERDTFYDNPKWIRLRNRILRRDKYMDMESKRYGVPKPAEVVHHIFPKGDFPEYAFSEWNLISLSRKSHNEMHIRESEGLSEKGIELLKRTCRKYGIEVPSKYGADALQQAKQARIKRDRYYDYD